MDSVYTGYYNQFVTDSELDPSVNPNSITHFIDWLDNNAAPEQNSAPSAPSINDSNTDFSPVSNL